MTEKKMKKSVSKKVSTDDSKKIEQDLDKVKKETIENQKTTKKKKENDSEPTFLDYIIVLVVLGAIFTGIYFAFEWYDNKYNDPNVIDNPNLNIKLYKYPFTVNDLEYSIQFYNPVSELNKIDFPIEISKEQLLTTQDFTFVFNSDLSSNGQVAKVSGRLFPFLKGVYKFPLDTTKHIVSSDNLTCENSTLENKYIFFNSNSTNNQVSFNESNGCITFETTNQNLMGTLGDKFFLKIINEE